MDAGARHFERMQLLFEIGYGRTRGPAVIRSLLLGLDGFTLPTASHPEYIMADFRGGLGLPVSAHAEASPVVLQSARAAVGTARSASPRDFQKCLRGNP